MYSTIHYTNCPVCGSNQIQQNFTVKDYTVSQQNFQVWHCNACAARFTQDAPNAENIGAYYQSENYISHSDTQKGFINKLYHFIRNYTLQSKKNLVNQTTHLTKGSLLDVGAGTGSFASTMQQAGWNVMGLEPDESARNNALQKHSLQLQPPEDLYNFSAQQFNAITMWHVLEHVHDLHKYFETFYYILKDDGKLIIAVPNYTSYDAGYYKQFWAAYDVPRHLYHFSPASMQTLAKLKGFTVKRFKPMWFDSVYVSMLSEQYKTGKQNFLKALFIGLASNIKTLINNKNCSSVIYVLEKNI